MWTSGQPPAGGGRRGGALLAVLWLSAALSAIAFSLANTVRGEIERAGTASDGVRAYYLAAGSIERAILYLQWGSGGALLPDGTPRYYASWMPVLRFVYPSGEVLTEVIPASARLNINTARPEEIYRLLIALGAEPERAGEITEGILDWRTPQPPGRLTPFDAFYLAQPSSFLARHASLQEIEEVLLIKGMTPELFHGGFERTPDGRLAPRTGLKDCIGVYGSGGAVDVNSAEPALLLSVGLPPEVVQAIVRTRRVNPFRSVEQVRAMFGGGAVPGLDRLRVGGSTIYTLRATARPRLPDGRLSDLRRTVAATVKFFPPDYDIRLQILRWYDDAPAGDRGF